MAAKKTYFVYHDQDHNEIEIFTSLDKAKAHADEKWPDSVGKEWEEGKGRFRREPYQYIFVRKVNS